MTGLLKTFFILFFTALLSGCEGFLGSSDDPVLPEVCTHPIEDSEEASYVAAHISSAIRSEIYELSDGIYSGIEVPCYFGSMRITGVISRVENEPCGTDCTANYNNHEIIADMSSCSYIYNSFLQSTITGVVNYSDTRGDQITGEDVTHIGGITITDNGTVIEFKPTYIYTGGLCNYSVKEVQDTISSISSSGESSYQWDQSGSLTSTGGTFFFEANP